mmetsp:Transcript_17456/g.52372  ORF Transcript_17456/g.52372 Transcript_17456/m.52372 type:complete len:235 (+) Transcript_17456:281-985(+)
MRWEWGRCRRRRTGCRTRGGWRTAAAPSPPAASCIWYLHDWCFQTHRQLALTTASCTATNPCLEMPTPANQRCQPGMPQRQTALFPRLTGRLTEAAPAVMGTAAMRVRKQTVQRTCRRWRLVLASASLGRLIHPLQLRWWMDACSHLHLQGPACPVPCSRQQQGRKQAAVGNVHYWLEAAVRAVLLRRLLRGPRLRLKRHGQRHPPWSAPTSLMYSWTMCLMSATRACASAGLW